MVYASAAVLRNSAKRLECVRLAHAFGGRKALGQLKSGRSSRTPNASRDSMPRTISIIRDQIKYKN
jgi:hypothetical protein